MTQIRNHGGSCCGARHIVGMGVDDFYYDNLLKFVKKEIRKLRAGPTNGADKSGKYLEIIMTDYQIKSSPKLVAGLKKLGFKLRTRFNNSSGSWCNVLVYTHKSSRLKDSPWNKV